MGKIIRAGIALCIVVLFAQAGLAAPEEKVEDKPKTVVTITYEDKEKNPVKNELELSLYERVMWGSVLPRRANRVEGLIISDIREKIDPTQEEIKKYEIVDVPPTGVGWNKAGVKSRIKVTFTELEAQISKEALKKMDEDEDLPANKEFMDLYEKINNLE